MYYIFQHIYDELIQLKEKSINHDLGQLWRQNGMKSCEFVNLIMTFTNENKTTKRLLL